jgi:FKBP-type peptidyl-prolyl cis-trans isomerase FklB
MDDKLKNEASYCLGLDVGKNLIQNGISDVSVSEFEQGFQAAFSGADARYSEEEVKTILNQFFMSMQEKAGAANIEAGKSYLEENAKRDEVTVTESGLQYEVIEEGSGKQPAISDQVTTHYHGTLIDGTVFDSSVERGQPATFPVNGVIQGWVEALQLMKEGSKWRLHVPSELAYGGQAAGSIAPHSTLIFDVELISVN